MKKAHFILRITGYVSGLLGLLLLVVGRNISGSSENLASIGAGLLVLMFVTFALSYVVYFAFLMKR
ncbi:MAG: hypothetical protein KJ626_14315 [Verrucomicrobia bacterium]|nr:hypothetical protein [Verrucomicrobiota bacterium]